jgi:hypothetical protein
LGSNGLKVSIDAPRSQEGDKGREEVFQERKLMRAKRELIKKDLKIVYLMLQYSVSIATGTFLS